MCKMLAVDNNTFGYEKKEIVMNSESLYVLWNVCPLPRKGRGKRREEHRELSLALKILILCSTCLKIQLLPTHSPFATDQLCLIQSHCTTALQPLYTRTRMENSRKEESNLIWSRHEGLQKRGRQIYWVLKRPSALDPKAFSHNSLSKIMSCTYQLCEM